MDHHMIIRFHKRNPGFVLETGQFSPSRQIDQSVHEWGFFKIGRFGSSVSSDIEMVVPRTYLLPAPSDLYNPVPPGRIIVRDIAGPNQMRLEHFMFLP